MREQDQEGRPKSARVFNRPNPYDLAILSATFDDREVISPPRTYIPATDPERQLIDVTTDLQEVFRDQLMFVGLTGSRVESSEHTNRDLDVLAIVDNSPSAVRIAFQGDLKIVAYSGLREFIEYGHQLVTSQFRKAQPIFQREGAQPMLDEARTWKVIPEKAVSFLIAKSRFNQQSSDIYRLMSRKYRAIFLQQHGMEQEAYEQLEGDEQDELFRSLQTDYSDDDPRLVYAQNARFYATGGLNRMFQSISEMLQALYVKEVEDIPEVEQLISWAGFRLGDTVAELFQYIYDKRNACYKAGEFLTDISYDAIRERIGEINPIIERLVLEEKIHETRNDEQPSLGEQ